MQAHFASELKALYARLASIIDHGTRSTILYIKQRMIGRVSAMLCERTLTRTLTLTLILTLSQARVGDAERAAGA